MASPASTAFRAELEAALTVIVQQITGHQSLVNDKDLPAPTLAALNLELAADIRRRDLLTAGIKAIDALHTDGYPETPLREVAAEIIASLKARQAAIAAAIAEFEPMPVASLMSIGLGTPAEKAP